ncbi:MAG: ABC transporter permease [Coriobacteriia bacterium]|nr:ABC transporter permease [Coriobacteriia bacterium]
MTALRTTATAAGNAGEATRSTSKIFREINATFTVMMRDVILYFKSPGMAIMSLAMPAVMMGMIGGNLMQNMAKGLSFSFGPFMLVGMLVTMMFMTTTMGMSSLVDDSDSNFSEEMLVSPVSRYSIVIGKILGCSFAAIVSTLGAIIVGLIMNIQLPVKSLLLILAFSPLMCLSGGALAMIFIGLIKNKKAANMAVMLITMPQMFLSGGIIPISSSNGVLKVISRCLPMTYCIDLVRSFVGGGQPHMFNPAVNFVAIVGLTVVCLVIGTYLFARTEKSR